jgi:salmonella plasmid virulence protein D
MIDFWLVANPRFLANLALSLVVPAKQDRQYSSTSLTRPTETDPKLLDTRNRMLRALKVNQKPTLFNPEHYDKKNLEHVVREVNAAHVHFSGNCALLSTTLMYNLLNEHQCYLAAKNTYPIFEGISEYHAAEILLGQGLKPVGDARFVHELTEDEIIEHYEKTGEHVFLISLASFNRLTGATGHVLNALVYLDEQAKPRVQFMDAWRTSKPLFSIDYLKKHYNSHALCSIQYCPNKKLIQNHSSLRENHDDSNQFKASLNEVKNNNESTPPLDEIDSNPKKG